MTPTALALAELGRKYAALLRLRLEHDRHRAVRGDGRGHERQDPRRDMAALAERYPGALREIDELPLETIRARIAELREAEADRRLVRPWMTAMHLFHLFARGALSAKRWLAGRKRVDAGLSLAFEKAAPTLPFPKDAMLWKDDLAKLARPPRGRVTELVYARVALAMKITAAEAKLLVFGPSRRGRGRRGG
jgi:hypothetical protein